MEVSRGFNVFPDYKARKSTTLSAKKMDIDARAQSDDKKLVAGMIEASREEILDKLMKDANVVDVTPESPKLSG